MSKKFSIIIPTFKNYDYLKLCLESILKNSYFNHQIIIHINGVDNKTQTFLDSKKIVYTKTDNNVGLCSGVNLATKLVDTNYVLYAHDDMYFLPDWDLHLHNEVKKIDHERFYLSMTNISHMKGVKGDLQHIIFNCGESIENFDEIKLLNNFKKFNFRDIQGSHWAPHLVHVDLWKSVGGFSEEFNPGFASDPDLNMKLWNQGVRIFKGVSLSRVYHFGSLTTRKNIKIIPNKGKKTFLLKWKISVEFFTKHILKRGTVYNGPLTKPNKNFSFFFDLFLSKIKYLIASIS